MDRRTFLKSIAVIGASVAASKLAPEEKLYELKCDNCGGCLLIADRDLFECEYCGSLYVRSTEQVTMDEVERDEPDYFYRGGVSIRCSTPDYTVWNRSGVLTADPDPFS